MKMASIASGSNGNCYYVENDDDAVLIDAGVSTKQIVERMARLGLSLSKLRGVFISHEHTDHIRGIDVFSRKHAVPVFMTQKTHASSGVSLKTTLSAFFPGKPVQMGSIRVHPFLKSHDAIEPCGFSVSSGSSRVAVLTDVGLHCENVIEHIRNADALFLESNYDDQMLKTGPYPVHLKKGSPPIAAICPTPRPACLPSNMRPPGLNTSSCRTFQPTTTRRNWRSRLSGGLQTKEAN